MKIESARIVEGKLLLKGEGREFYLMDGVYRSDNSETVTVRDHQIVSVLTAPDLVSASKEQIENYITELENAISKVGNDAQLANIDLQNALQRQQQSLQTISNLSKTVHDTAMAIIRRIR
jgi:hypothetical protein